MTYEEMKSVELKKQDYTEDSVQFANRELTTVLGQNHMSEVTTQLIQDKLAALENSYSKYREDEHLVHLLEQAVAVHKEINKYLNYEQEKVINLGDEA